MVSQSINYTGLNNNRPGYAIPITFIGLFILTPIVTAVYQKYKDYSITEINENLNNIIFMIVIVLVIIIFIMGLLIEFYNCIKYDIQLKIGERLVQLCGNNLYYQRETSDELIASMIYTHGNNPKYVEDSPLKVNFIINTILTIIFLSIVTIYFCIIMFISQLLILDPSTSGIFDRWKNTVSIQKKVISIIIFLIQVGYILFYIGASVTEITNIGIIKKDSLKKMSPAKYFGLKIGLFALFGGILWLLTIFGIGEAKVGSSYYMKLWNSSNVLKILFISGLIILGLTYFYKISYEKLSVAVNEYLRKCNILNKYIIDIISSTDNTLVEKISKCKNILYKGIIENEPNVDDSIDKLINDRKDILYQYIKHNNGKELIEIQNILSTTELENIRRSMKELRNFASIKDTFKSHNNEVFGFFSIFILVTFYIIFNYNYKNNISQTTLLTVISIVILIIITCIFGWFSNAIIMS